jgi:hypothetical protein
VLGVRRLDACPEDAELKGRLKDPFDSTSLDTGTGRFRGIFSVAAPSGFGLSDARLDGGGEGNPVFMPFSWRRASLAVMESGTGSIASEDGGGRRSRLRSSRWSFSTSTRATETRCYDQQCGKAGGYFPEGPIFKCLRRFAAFNLSHASMSRNYFNYNAYCPDIVDIGGLEIVLCDIHFRLVSNSLHTRDQPDQDTFLPM